MSDLYQKLETCLASVRKRTDFKPEVALILGSGLGDYADEIQIETTIDYTEIEGFQLHSCRPQRQICIWICEKCAGCDHAGKSALL